MIYIMYIVKVKLYEDPNYLEKVQGTIGFYALGMVITFIPIINTLGVCFFMYMLIRLLLDEEIYYKPGRILKFLNKKW